MPCKSCAVFGPIPFMFFVFQIYCSLLPVPQLSHSYRNAGLLIRCHRICTKTVYPERLNQIIGIWQHLLFRFWNIIPMADIRLLYLFGVSTSKTMYRYNATAPSNNPAALSALRSGRRICCGWSLSLPTLLQAETT